MKEEIEGKIYFSTKKDEEFICKEQIEAGESGNFYVGQGNFVIAQNLDDFKFYNENEEIKIRSINNNISIYVFKKEGISVNVTIVGREIELTETMLHIQKVEYGPDTDYNVTLHWKTNKIKKSVSIRDFISLVDTYYINISNKNSLLEWLPTKFKNNSFDLGELVDYIDISVSSKPGRVQDTVALENYKQVKDVGEVIKRHQEIFTGRIRPSQQDMKEIVMECLRNIPPDHQLISSIFENITSLFLPNIPKQENSEESQQRTIKMNNKLNVQNLEYQEKNNIPEEKKIDSKVEKEFLSKLEEPKNILSEMEKNRKELNEKKE
jgi:hypothetical protein